MRKKTMLGMAACLLALMLAGQGLAYELLSGVTGMSVWNEDKAYNGYTLYTPEGGTNTYLIDMNGEVVHTWPALGNPMLMKNGDIFGTYGDRHAYGDLVIMDWNGNVKKRWEAPQDFRPNAYTDADPANPQGHPTAFHHDWIVIEGSPHVPAGKKSVLAVMRVGRTKAEAEDAGFGYSTAGFGAIQIEYTNATGQTVTAKYGDTDALIEFDMDGNVVWYWEFFDHMFHDNAGEEATSHYYGLTTAEDKAANPDPFDRIHFKKLYKASIAGDTIHTNSIDFNPVRMEVLMNPVKESSFYVVDFNTTTEQAQGSAGDFIYRWGDPSEWEPNAVTAGVATYNTIGNKKNPSYETTDYGKHDSMIGGCHNVQWIDEGLPGEGNFLMFSNAGTPYLDGGSAIVEVNPYTNDAFASPDTNWKVDPYQPQDYGTTQTAVDDGQSLRSFHLGGKPNNNFKTGKQVVMYFATQYALGQYEKVGFYSGHISGCQRLRNGNTLVCAGEAGHFFEITESNFAGSDLATQLKDNGVMSDEDIFCTDMLCRGSEVVWDFVNPFALPRENERGWYEDLAEATNSTYEYSGQLYDIRPAGVDAQVFRCLRYTGDSPELENKTLVPLGQLNEPDEWENKVYGDYSWMFGFTGGSGGGASGGSAGGVGGGAGY